MASFLAGFLLGTATTLALILALTFWLVPESNATSKRGGE